MHNFRSALPARTSPSRAKHTSSRPPGLRLPPTPINGRNFLDFATISPGLARDTLTGQLSFGCQRGPANSLLVDDVDSNNLFFGQSAGRAGGGVVNAITKSGTNGMHGNGFWFFRDRSLNADTSLNNSCGIARQPYHFNQFGGTLGGPAKKDKLFYFRFQRTMERRKKR